MKNPNRLPDTFCPECGGDYKLLSATPSRLRKQCLECAHPWSEEPPPPPLHDGQWVHSERLARLRDGYVAELETALEEVAA